MNPILHQWKWDFRRIRTLWFIWVILLAGSTFGALRPDNPSETANALNPLFTFARYATIYLFGLLLVSRVMYNTPFSGTGPDWKTRPITRNALTWSKTLMILLGIFLPIMVIQIVSMQMQNLGGVYIFWASLQFGFLTLAIFLLAATWSAVCDRSATAWLGVTATAGLLGVVTLIYSQLKMRLSSLPFQLEESAPFAASAKSSTTLTMVFIYLLAAVAAWIFCTRLRNIRAGSLAILIGIVVAGGAHNIWRLDFFRSLNSDSPKETSLTTVVLDRDDSVSAEHQLLWNQIAVKVPKNQFVQPSTWHVTMSTDSGGKQSRSGHVDWSSWESRHHQRLRQFYPEGTHLQTSQLRQESCISNSHVANKMGHLVGHSAVTIYEWRKVASLSLASRSTTKLDGGGVLQLGDVKDNRLKVVTITPPQPFSSGMQPLTGSHADRNERFAHVLYHEQSGSAVVAHVKGVSFQSGGSFVRKKISSTLALESGSRNWSLLTKLKNLEEGRDDIRLDVFQAVPVGNSVLHWNRENWLSYLGRELPLPEAIADHPAVVAKPSIERTLLPRNPTPEQVDRYLDGILYSLPDRMSREESQQTEADLKAIGSQNLGRLLARIPVGSYANNIVHRVLKDELSEEHQADYLDALSRDAGLAHLSIPRGWQAQAAPVLARKLRDHRVLGYSTSAVALQIVASQADPDTFEDLRWHFLHSPHNLGAMAKALRDCPGFPYEQALAERWSQARFESGRLQSDLAPFAARLGDKEALRIAYLHYMNGRRDADLQLLSEAVEHPGGDLLPGWLHDNFAALTFNKDTRTFSLNR